jgi:ribosomal protein S18 acetylase RimI-like enzyme
VAVIALRWSGIIDQRRCTSLPNLSESYRSALRRLLGYPYRHYWFTLVGSISILSRLTATEMRIEVPVEQSMIEQVTEADLPDLHHLIETALRGAVVSTAEEVAFLMGEIDKILKWWAENSERCIHRKFVEGGAIVGMILVKDFWNLSCLFVAPGYQRRGIGKALLLEVLSECRKRSPDKCVKLNSSTNAVAFYQSCGFRQCGPSKDLPGGCVPLRLDF